MFLNIYQIATFVLLNFAAFPHVNGQIPLGLDKYDTKIYFPEFFAYGKKLVPARLSNSDSEVEQLKFRRHAKIETSQRRIGKSESSEESRENHKPLSADSFMKMLRSEDDLLGHSRPKSRGSVTFLSKNKEIDREIRNLRDVERTLIEDGEEIPFVGKRIRTVKRRVKKPRTRNILKVERSEVLRSLNGKPSDKLSDSKRAFDPQEAFQNYQNRDHKPKSSNDKKGKTENSEGESRPRKPLEKLIPEQYKRVLKMAKTLNIPTGLENRSFKGGNQFIIVSPKGAPDEGSLAYIRIKPEIENGRMKTSFNFDIMRGPYDDIYHRQLLNDLNGVSAILGRSAKFTALSDMNYVLSNIALNSKWDIQKLR